MFEAHGEIITAYGDTLKDLIEEIQDKADNFDDYSYDSARVVCDKKAFQNEMNSRDFQAFLDDADDDFYDFDSEIEVEWLNRNGRCIDDDVLFISFSKD